MPAANRRSRLERAAKWAATILSAAFAILLVLNVLGCNPYWNFTELPASAGAVGGRCWIDIVPWQIGWSIPQPIGPHLKESDYPFHWWRWGAWRWGIEAPAWALATFTGLPAAILWRRALRRPRPGACPRCGYTLAGLPKDAACPECGSDALTS